MEDILADAKKILMSVHSSILTRMSSALMERPLVETPMMKTTAVTPRVIATLSVIVDLRRRQQRHKLTVGVVIERIGSA